MDELIDDMELLIDGDEDENALHIAGALRLEKEQSNNEYYININSIWVNIKFS